MDDLSSQIKKLGVKGVLFLLKELIFIKRILCFLFLILKKAAFFLFHLLLKCGGKKVVLLTYKTYLWIKRLAAKTFLPAKNKFIYPFVHKETIHAVIIVLTLAICFDNIRIRTSRAESMEELLSRESIISKFATEELGDSLLIEENISNGNEIAESEISRYSNTTNFGVKSSGEIGTSTLDFLDDFHGTRILANSEGLVKPDITSTAAEPISEGEPTATGRTEIIEYIVQRGDIIGNIAAKFGITVNTILWSNSLSYYSVIRPGDKLKIMPVSGVLHKVASGENLGSIANKYTADIEKIKEYNKLADANSLQKGQELIIPDGVMRAAPRARTVAQANPYAAISSSSRAQYSSSSKFVWPAASKRITQYYHWGHSAIDIGAKIGTPIYSIEKGQITFSGWSNGYGYNIIVDHGGGQKSRYAHFSKLYVKKGALVDKGQQIGEMGSTGWSTGPHLHIEIIINGVKVNPLKYLQ